jgi:phosphatidylinositol alpha-1,6-mannosyltransferase
MTAGAPRSLLLTHDFPPMGGGIARALGEIARHAPEGRLVVSTARLPDCAAFDAGCAATVDRLPFPPARLRSLSGLAWWAARSGRLTRRHGTEFVWAGNLKPAGYVARWLRARRRLPYGLIVYGLDVQRLAAQVVESRGKRRMARLIIGGAAGTVAISSWTAGRFRDLAELLELPDAMARVRLVSPGVDAGRFRPGIATEAARAAYDLDGRPWLLTVARLVRHKGIDVGLRVVRRLKDEGLDVGYAVAGAGPEAARLREQAAELGIGDRVRLLGHVPDPHLPALYNVASLYLGPSRQEAEEVEGFGLSLLEAAASGLAVVAGQGGGTGDAVADGITGLLVDPTSVPAASVALRALLEDPSRARVMGQAGRTRVEREFAWSRVVHDLEEAARQFTAGPGRPAGR